MVRGIDASLFDDDEVGIATGIATSSKKLVEGNEEDALGALRSFGWLKNWRSSNPDNNKVRFSWAKTVGVASIYLKKPVLPPLSEYKNILVRRHEPTVSAQGSGARGVDRYMDPDFNHRSVPERTPDTGAQARVLRKLELCKDTESGCALLDLGIGARLGLHPLKLQPVARIRIGNLVTIKCLPEPVIKLSQSLPIQVAGLQAHLRYEAPIPALMDSMDALYKPPARFLLRFAHESNSGVHFYPGGLEVSDCTIPLGSTGSGIRIAAGYSFPRELPCLPENRGTLELRKLGLTTLW